MAHDDAKAHAHATLAPVESASPRFVAKARVYVPHKLRTHQAADAMELLLRLSDRDPVRTVSVVAEYLSSNFRTRFSNGEELLKTTLHVTRSDASATSARQPGLHGDASRGSRTALSARSNKAGAFGGNIVEDSDLRSDLVMSRWLRDRERRQRQREGWRSDALARERQWLERLNELQSTRNKKMQREEAEEEAARRIQGGFKGMKDRKSVKILRVQREREEARRKEEERKKITGPSAEELYAADAAKLFA